MGYEQPSPVQEAALAPMLEGKDLLVQAPTGTGKTAAFGIPAVERVNTANRNIQTVILCPTRELAVQTADVLKKLTAFKPGIRVLALYGGQPIQRQIMALKRRPQIIVATPGRMLDHIQRRTTRLGHVGCVVLDEADRMLDMGFREDIAAILHSVPEERQTVLFSATLSNDIKRIASEYQTDVQQIVIEQETSTVEKVQQFYSVIRGNKTAALLELFAQKNFPLSLVFVATKAMADSLAKQLTEAGISAEALHGDLRQSQRDQVMSRYRAGKVGVLVATDVAARGIDVHCIDAVVNYDIPTDCEGYIHRIGRTGRADQNGLAYTFIYPRERAKLEQIMRVTQAAILPFRLSADSMGRNMINSAAPSGRNSGKPKERRRSGQKRRGCSRGRANDVRLGA